MSSDKFKEVAGLDVTNTINQIVDMLIEDGTLNEETFKTWEEYQSLENTMDELVEIIGEEENA